MDISQSVSVAVDDREPPEAVLAALQRRPGVLVRVERLPIGDYRVDDRLIFERKTLTDLVASIKDGRLFAQGLRLVNAPLRAALILEGRSRDLADNRMRREAIQGALLTLTLFLRLPLLRSMDPEETATLILLAGRQARAVATGSLPRKGRRPHGKSRLQGHILQGLPRVGPARARRLLDRFGSVAAVMSAPASDLAAVPGIGKEIAAAIRWAVEDTPASFGDASADVGFWPF